MRPALPAGALVAVSPLRGEPALGAIVVVRRPEGTEHLKRIVGAPGDIVTQEDGAPVSLAPGEYWVAGDNRPASTDSRHYGPVMRRDIVAVARFCYWPPRAWKATRP